MDTNGDPKFSRKYVRVLGETENQFLQVLVTQFEIQRKARGLELHATFNRRSPAICSDAAKSYLRKILPEPRRSELQAEIDAFVAGKADKFEYKSANFPFRLGNGGTSRSCILVGRTTSASSTAICIRKVGTSPTGAPTTSTICCIPPRSSSGSCAKSSSSSNPNGRRRYVFEWHDAHLRDHPDFARADELWMERLRRRGYRELTHIPLPLKWIPPGEGDWMPRETAEYDSVHVVFGAEDEADTGHGFLNINAEDFGIEFDRIAKLSVGPDAIFCDGELHGRELLDRVVGLFEVGKLLDRLSGGGEDGIPSRSDVLERPRTDR